MLVVDLTFSVDSILQFVLNSNYKILKIHNPWLRDKKLLNPTKKKYEIQIPLSGF